MRHKIIVPALFLFWSSSAIHAQINTYLGANIQGLYTGLRMENASYRPGFGTGASIYYWEYDYWFIKAGIDYMYKSSLFPGSPILFDQAPPDPDREIMVDYRQHDVGIPITAYFRLIEQGGNALLLTGTLEMSLALKAVLNAGDYESLVLTGNDIDKPLRTNLGVGAGYQLQINRETYFNIIPSFHLDLRSDRPFNVFKLTVEMMFGVY
ncbi:MAG: hypothetical protein JXR52_06055 [Bacteroidales bacterium]|nr:hypothetical protein [Bacteroidales bacterium]